MSLSLSADKNVKLSFNFAEDSVDFFNCYVIYDRKLRNQWRHASLLLDQRKTPTGQKGITEYGETPVIKTVPTTQTC